MNSDEDDDDDWGKPVVKKKKNKERKLSALDDWRERYLKADAEGDESLKDRLMSEYDRKGLRWLK